jgi:Icc-related predicted phosphoesterase
MVLVLAGDIGIATNPLRLTMFLEDVCETHKHVVMIMGNHEHYHGGDIRRSGDLINKATSHLDNFTLLDNSTVTVDNHTFIGATLWTDFNNNNPLVMLEVAGMLNDYKHILIDGKMITTADILNEFNDAKTFIADEVSKSDRNGTTPVIITHHAPSSMSRDPAKDINYRSFAFYSNIDEFIYQMGVPLWLHGHLHYCVDYTIGGTRIISNPRGYPCEGIPFNPGLVVDTDYR